MANSFAVRVYGTVNTQPPYVADVNGQLPAVQATFTSNQIQLASFSVGRSNVFAVQPGVKMLGGVYCYGVVEVAPDGLQLYSQKFIVKEDVATLATLRG